MNSWEEFFRLVLLGRAPQNFFFFLMVSKDKSDFAKRRGSKTDLKNTNRKTDGSAETAAAKNGGK